MHDEHDDDEPGRFKLDHDLSQYSALREQLLPREVRVYFNGRHQLVFSTQHGPAWPNRSNSGWVTHAGGTWHISTWQPIAYTVPPGANIHELCIRFLMQSEKVMWEIPADMVRAFGLRALSDQEFDALSALMSRAP